ncbi:RNA 2',3'-cyclic phosphodiesterase [Shewanella livingstonensis]|uniref:RNA 2',3'-cyclic phosphodiesterase n=1 Tax=Shewanella livingstonensis TaxID=150120 RepID=A0A3G8LXW8_9GAMM|nr:RNA 2',3'-cyclic phosphodiesterase [Shewanella livingstonensis]AZG74593.1 RNA 2',3'-cyclic phosphodiesterase [Shewanella livingstonensis]
MQTTSSRRLFVGFSLDKSQEEKILLLQHRLKLLINNEAKIVSDTNLHMTLGFLGQVDPTSYTSIINAIGLMHKPIFQQPLDTLALWQSTQLICLKGQASKPLLAMIQSLISIAKQHNLFVSQHQYTPHISLFRHVNMTNLPILGCTTNLSLTPTHLHLYQSINNSQQINYSIIKSWPLIADDKKPLLLSIPPLNFRGS